MEKTETTEATIATDARLARDPARLARMMGKTWPTTLAEDIAFDPEAEAL